MEFTAGNRSTALGKQIDELSEFAADMPPGFVSKLQEILNTFAYFATQSEASVLDDHESWHDEYHTHLRNETESKKTAQQTVQQTARPVPPSKQRVQKAAVMKVTIKAAAAKSAAAKPRRKKEDKYGDTDGMALYDSAEASIPRGSSNSTVSPSLMAIMEGTHPSLRD